MAEEAEGRISRSTLERLRQLQKEMEVEEDEFVHGMLGRMRKTEELKKMNIELKKRLEAVKEEVSLVEEQLWKKKESMQIIWEMCRQMKRELDRGEEASGKYHKDEIQRTTQGTKRMALDTPNDGQDFSKVDEQQVSDKFDPPQRKTPLRFAPQVCSSPMPSPIKHVTFDSSASVEMGTRRVSTGRQAQNDTGNLSRSQMLMNFGPEVINAKEREVFVRSNERVGASNLTDSLRKRRFTDISDPDLQIVTSRQRNMASDFQIEIERKEGDKMSKSNESEMQSRHFPSQGGLRSKLEEVMQAVRREATRFKGEMEVVGQQREGQAHRLAVLHERAMKEVILMAFRDMSSPRPPSAPRSAAGQGNPPDHSFLDFSSLSTSFVAHE